MILGNLEKLNHHNKRVMKLAGMTLSVASGYAQHRIKGILSPTKKRHDELSELYLTLGKEIAETLGELKGAAMKVGQIASQAKGLLPPEISQALEKLQKTASPLPFTVIKQQIERELDAPLELLFAWIEETPFAAASIGQVHRACTKDGHEVIVKVQYPGVRQSCDSDLLQLKVLLQMGRLVKIQGRVLNALFDEIRARIHEELDYINEANNIRLFRHCHRNDKNIVIPDVIDDLSTKQILTLTYEPGDSINEVKSPRYSEEVINQLGRRLFQALAKQLFLFHVVHADPQPGNFAFRPDGTLVVYDFGCVKKLKPETVEAYRAGTQAFLEEDYRRLDEAMIKLGIRIADGPPVEAEYYAFWRNILIQPFLADRSFDFATSRLHDEIVHNTPEIIRRLDSFQPAVETVYIDRVLGGHYWTLYKLGVNVSFFQDIMVYLGSNQRIPSSSYRTPLKEIIS
jgi:predicted unusual protein kinase regulating ubiquinone biosynthesis (AarF/ABC1/UbiB family)